MFQGSNQELRKDFANGYLEKAIKQDFEGVNAIKPNVSKKQTRS